MLADIGKLGLDLAPHLAKSVVGDANAARRGQPLEPCGDVDAIAEEIVAVEDHVAEIDPDPELDAAVGRIDGVALRHRLLHRDGTAHRVDDAAELGQHPVACGLDDAALMLGDAGIDQLIAVRLQPRERAFLVLAHQPAVARDIGRQDRRQPALDPLHPHYCPPRRAVYLAPMPSADQPRSGSPLVQTEPAPISLFRAKILIIKWTYHGDSTDRDRASKFRCQSAADRAKFRCQPARPVLSSL